MTDDEMQSIMREIADQQKSIERRLESIESSAEEISKTYESTYAEYRRVLDDWKGCKYCGAIDVVARVLVFVLLLYVAYRVS